MIWWRETVISSTILVCLHCLEILSKLFSAQYIYIAVGSSGSIWALFTLRASGTVYWYTNAQVMHSRSSELERLYTCSVGAFSAHGQALLVRINGTLKQWYYKEILHDCAFPFAVENHESTSVLLFNMKTVDDRWLSLLLLIWMQIISM